MILSIVLLILFILLLTLITFFTLYFIIPSIKDEKRQDDPIIPKLVPPQTLPKVRNITPFEQVKFVQKVTRPISLEEKINLLNRESEPENMVDEKSSEKNNNSEEKYLKIWAICYRIIDQLKL